MFYKRGQNIFFRIDESSIIKIVSKVMKYLLYTNGSCDNYSIRKEGSYAYVILDYKKNVVKSFSKGVLKTTSSIMELTAIIEGCKAIPDDKSEVVIYSNSQYALNVLSGKWQAHVNRSLINDHDVNKKRLRLKYNWIKAKCGNKFNDAASLLAETELDNMRMKHGIDVPSSHLAYRSTYPKRKKY
jgi:ribonuclease HI